MATKKQTAASVTLTLKLSKETKGTWVYGMVTQAGVEVGSVYLPKLLFPAGQPGEALRMTITEQE